MYQNTIASTAFIALEGYTTRATDAGTPHTTEGADRVAEIIGANPERVLGKTKLDINRDEQMVKRKAFRPPANPPRRDITAEETTTTPRTGEPPRSGYTR